MDKAEELNQYKQLLYSMLNAINQTIPIQEKDMVLIALCLDSIPKIQKWFEWIQKRITGENELQATKEEIVRAAVHIDKGIL